MSSSLLIGSRRLLTATLLLGLFTSIEGSARGQTIGRRIGGYQQRSLALTNAHIVSRPGAQPQRGHVRIDDGMITAVGDFDIPEELPQLDLDGLYLYAGFIDAANTSLLDSDIKPDSVEARRVDFGRHVLAAIRPDNHKSITPQFEAQKALKRDEKLTTPLRANGFCTVHVLPTGRIISGAGTLLSLEQLPLRESLLKARTWSSWRLFATYGSDYPNTLMGTLAHLRQHVLDARRQAQQLKLFEAGHAPRPAIDPTTEVLQQILQGRQQVVLRVTNRDSLHRGLDLCEEFRLSPVVWTSALDDQSALQRLFDRQQPVLLRLDFGTQPKIEHGSKPTTENASKQADSLQVKLPDPIRVQQDRIEQWKRQTATAGILEQNEVAFAVGTDGFDSPDKLIDALRVAIENGLSPTGALAALTTTPAAMLGQSEHLGAIEPGKLAHFAILTGPLENRASKLRYTVIGLEQFEFNKNAKPVSDQSQTDAKTDQVAGPWTIRLGREKPAEGTLELSQQSTTLTGTLSTNRIDGRLANGKVEGHEVAFDVVVGVGEDQLTFKFKGTHKSEKLSGNLTGPLGEEVPWQAERSSPPPEKAQADNSKKDKTAQQKSAQPDDSLPEWPTELPADRLPQLGTQGNLLVTHATIMTGTGQTLRDTSILIEDGKITRIAREIQPPEGVRVIDATGRVVTPGLIDTHSHIMITAGINESSQSIVPEVRVADVVNSEDVAEYRALAGGLTTARLLHGSANVIGGQDAVVKMRVGRTAQEHLFDGRQIGVKFALGENVKARTNRFPNTRLGVEATLNRAFLEAIDYRRQWMEYRRTKDRKNLLPPRRDLRLEALADIVDQRKFIHSHCYRADEILMLLRVASNLGIRVWSLQHVLEGYKIAPEIVAHGASCSTFSDWWAYKVEAYDATPYNAALLHEAGANVVIKSDDAELIRHMYLEAAKTIRYGGLDEHAALQTITLNSARELGIDDRVGSIEVGKDGDLAIFNGHPFDSFARCEMTIIDGEVYFDRSQRPTAMSSTAQKTSAKPIQPARPARRRQRSLRLPASDHGLYAIVDAELYPVDGEPISGGTVVIRDGRIAAIGKDVEIPPDAQVIKASGMHVYPGLFDPGTTLGLTEIGRVNETNDYSESGTLQPDLRAGVAINPDSELFPVARAGGICTILVRPTSGLIAGQASLAKLSGWTAPQMVMELEAGLQINWPRSSDSSQLKQMREFFEEAREYHSLVKEAEQAGRLAPVPDPRLEALRPYLEGQRQVFIEADSRSQIAEALLFAEKEKLDIVITGAADAWKMADELKSREVPVILGSVMQRPMSEHDPFDAPYANAAHLHEAGVLFAIRSKKASNSRNTPFEAGMAVCYGLPQSAALRAITLSPAEILGVADELGSLTVGKRATFVISNGSPLIVSSQVQGIFIDGQPFAPESKHTRMYQRYRERVRQMKLQAAAPTEAP